MFHAATYYYNCLSQYLYRVETAELNKKLLLTHNDEITKDDFVKIGFVSIKDLKSVNLSPIKNMIPNPSRNAPPCFDKVDLRNLNRAQLNSILNVKLKPVPKIDKIRKYEVRHPCLRELLTKRNVIY